MNFTLKILDVRTIHELEGYWSSDDYRNLLEEFNFSDAGNSDPSELRELIEMGISDLEPHESAEILLRYKLKGVLSEGQIKNLSHEMAEENESEEYPDMAFHYPLFNINQLLYSAYNGIFPNAKATRVELELTFKGGPDMEVTRELVLKAIGAGLRDNNLIIRLFKDQLNGKVQFHEAEKIIWELHDLGQNNYVIITSDYWINEEDLIEYDFSGSIKQFEEK